MQITLVTFVTPASENIRGTSALPYHLIKGRSGTSYENEMLTLRNAFATKNEVEIEIYTFNNNKLSDEKIAEVEKEIRRDGNTEKRIDGTTERRKYGNTERRKYGNTEFWRYIETINE